MELHHRFQLGERQAPRRVALSRMASMVSWTTRRGSQKRHTIGACRRLRFMLHSDVLVTLANVRHFLRRIQRCASTFRTLSLQPSNAAICCIHPPEWVFPSGNLWNLVCRKRQTRIQPASAPVMWP